MKSPAADGWMLLAAMVANVREGEIDRQERKSRACRCTVLVIPCCPGECSGRKGATP